MSMTEKKWSVALILWRVFKKSLAVGNLFILSRNLTDKKLILLNTNLSIRKNLHQLSIFYRKLGFRNFMYPTMNVVCMQFYIPARSHNIDICWCFFPCIYLNDGVSINTLCIRIWNLSSDTSNRNAFRWIVMQFGYDIIVSNINIDFWSSYILRLL